MDIGILIGIAGVVVGLIGLGYAIRSDRKRAKLTSYINASMHGMRGSLVTIKQNALWAKQHFDNLAQLVPSIPDQDTREKAVKSVVEGRSDAKACDVAHDIIQNQFATLLPPEDEDKKSYT